MQPIEFETWNTTIKKEKKCSLLKFYQKKSSKDKSKKDKKGKGNAEKCAEDKGYCDPECPGVWTRPRQEMKKETRREPVSLEEIGQSVGDNCCTCCRALGLYFKDIAKLICCVSNAAKPGYDTKLGELFCVMLKTMGYLIRDLCSVIKYLYNCYRK